MSASVMAAARFLQKGSVSFGGSLMGMVELTRPGHGHAYGHGCGKQSERCQLRRRRPGQRQGWPAPGSSLCSACLLFAEVMILS